MDEEPGAIISGKLSHISRMASPEAGQDSRWNGVLSRSGNYLWTKPPQKDATIVWYFCPYQCD